MTANQQINSTDSDDWELVVELFRPSSNSDVPKFDLEQEFNADFIAVEVVASNQRSNWAKGGYLSQTYEFDSLRLTSTQYFIVLNQINLIKIERPAPIPYRLEFDPVRYLNDVQIRVWRYTGIQVDVLLQDIAQTLQNIDITGNINLNGVNSKLSSLENKIDEIYLLLNPNTEVPDRNLTQRQKFFLMQ